MKISDFVKQLQKIQNEKGDIEVYGADVESMDDDMHGVVHPDISVCAVEVEVEVGTGLEVVCNGPPPDGPTKTVCYVDCWA